jgi:hypothetical protein
MTYDEIQREIVKLKARYPNYRLSDNEWIRFMLGEPVHVAKITITDTSEPEKS